MPQNMWTSTDGNDYPSDSTAKYSITIRVYECNSKPPANYYARIIIAFVKILEHIICCNMQAM